MRGGTADGEACEIPGVGPVDVNWARELLGTAFLTAVIKRGKDLLTVAHLGRHIPAEIRTALLVAGRECDIDGCYQRGYLERDHTHDHAKGGPTTYANLAGSAPATTASKPTAGNSAHPTPQPANAPSDHHPDTPHDQRRAIRTRDEREQRATAREPTRIQPRRAMYLA